jgi:hypothetical protein
MVVQQGRRREETGGVAFSPPPPKLSEQLFPRVRYVEDVCDPRTKPVERRVSARQGREGDDEGIFSTDQSAFMSSRRTLVA